MSHAAVGLHEPGQVIARRYVIEEVLGRGGMAAVYRVLDKTTGQRCALKRAWGATESVLRRRQLSLEREFHTLAQLAHPRIIAVYDLGVDSDGPFYTMELLDGGDVSELGRCFWQQTARILRDVASSLAILHSRGLLHRDVSARNVRLSADGTAKLIDFGAMGSMGVDMQVVGTPPYMAPEVMQMQALDARADLFALGALGYVLLTGRHAYPARQLRDLRNVWRSAPTPPRRIVEDVPAALSSMIMDLLVLDRGARPHSASETMRRLCTIAQLPIEEDVAVARAYLAVPGLVGRDRALLTARKQILSLARGDGQLLLVQGAAGTGRSRMLDACVLEGKLMGALVVRAHAADSLTGAWGVARALIPQLVCDVGDQSIEPPPPDVLAHLIQDSDADADTMVNAPERGALIRELRDYVLRLAKRQRLMIVVDDVDHVDEPSLALLAALAHKTERHALIVVVASERSDTLLQSASMRLLDSIATHIEVAPFTASQTEALMRSVFGDVANLLNVSTHIHRVAQGNPRASMELAEHLVQRGLCRYEAGSWSLPDSIGEHDIPPTLTASLEARLLTLSPDAREMCEVASIREAPALSLLSFAKLNPDWHPPRVHAALHELVTARVLVLDGDQYRFSQPSFPSVARALIPDARRRALHAQMVDLLQVIGADPIVLTHHLFEAGRDLEAIQMLRRVDARVRHPSVAFWQRAVEAAERHRLPLHEIEDLRLRLVAAAAFALDREAFARHAERVIERLVYDSGLGLHRELSSLPPAERLTEALSRTHARFASTAEHERGHSIEDAIRKLAQLSLGFASVAIRTGDLACLDLFPKLDPLLPLSVGLGLMNEMLLAARHFVCGRFERALAVYNAVLARLEQPDRAGLDQEQQRSVRCACLILAGSAEAPVGIARYEERAKLLADERDYRVAAWRLRQQFHMSQGDTEQAKRCMRRAELLQVQNAREQTQPVASEVGLLIVYGRTEDLVGLQSVLGFFSSADNAEFYWQMLSAYGRSTSLRLQGDPLGALEILKPAIAQIVPGQHWTFTMIADTHLMLLLDLQRYDEAIEVGRAYLDTVFRNELSAARELQRPLGLALVRSGQLSEGMQLIEDLIRNQEMTGYSGIALGLTYEAAARVAMWANDRERFQRYTELCANTYKSGHNRALNARLARLLAEANPDGVVPTKADDAERAGMNPDEYETIYSRLEECEDKADRARCALTLLLQDARRFDGHLFGLTTSAGLTPLASLLQEPSGELSDWAARWFDAAVSEASAAQPTDDPTVTQDESITATEDAPARHVDSTGTFDAMLLVSSQEHLSLASGVLVLKVEPGAGRSYPNRFLVQQISALLLAHGDVSGAVLHEGEPVTR